MSAPTRMVVRLPNWLGDVMMALPALAAVRAGLGSGHLAVAGPAAFSELLGALPGVDEVVSLPSRAGLFGWRSMTEGATRLAAGRYETALLFTNSFSTCWQVARAEVPERWGYAADGRSRWLTTAVPRRRVRGDDDRHHARYYQHLVAALGFAATPPAQVALTCPVDMRERALRLLTEHGAVLARPVIGLAPGAAYGHAKRWPPGHVAALVAQIVRQTSASVVIVGAAGDRDTARQLQSSVEAIGVSTAGRVIDLVGQTSLGELMGVVAACRAFVSNDSGVMHLAAALGVPVAAVFGPTDERATAPLGPHRVVTAPSWCRPCQLRECPIDHHCMRGITPDAVFAALTELLREAGRGPHLDAAADEMPERV